MFRWFQVAATLAAPYPPQGTSKGQSLVAATASAAQEVHAAQHAPVAEAATVTEVQNPTMLVHA